MAAQKRQDLIDSFKNEDWEDLDAKVVTECLAFMAKHNIKAHSLVNKWEVYAFKTKLKADKDKITMDLLKKFFVTQEASLSETAASSGSGIKRARQSTSSGSHGPTRYGQSGGGFEFGSPAMKSGPPSKRLSYSGETTYTIDTIHNLKRATPNFGSLEATFGLKTPTKAAMKVDARTPTSSYRRTSTSSARVGAAHTPSPACERYAARRDVGKIVSTFNPTLSGPKKLAEREYQPDREVVTFRVRKSAGGGESGDEKPLSVNGFRFMDESLDDRHDALQRRLERFTDIFQAQLQQSARKRAREANNTMRDEDEDGDDDSPNGSDESDDVQVASLAMPSQTSLHYIGYVTCEGTGRLTSSTCMLRGDERSANAACVKLDFSRVREYKSLFPGQILGVKGVNDGRTLAAEELFDDFSAPNVKLPVSEVAEYHRARSSKLPLHMLVATGPYTTRDSLEYRGSGLEDFAKVVKREKPFGVVLVGPFVSATNELVKSNLETRPLDQVFVSLVSDFLADVGPIGLQVFIVPSTLDAAHPFVFPQPAFDNPFNRIMRERQLQAGQQDSSTIPDNHVECLPNPCAFRVNDVSFQIGSPDVVRDLRGADTAVPSDAAMTNAKAIRWQVLSEHLVKQRSFYPLYPPADDTNLDFTFYDHLAPISDGSPDLLLWTSPSSRIANANAGSWELCNKRTLAVFPGQLLNSAGAAGRYASIIVHSLSEGQCEITADGQSFVRQPPPVCDRTRVDIVRI